MNLAGEVAVQVRAELNQFHSGLSLSEKESRAFDARVSAGFRNVSRQASVMGQSVRGELALVNTAQAKTIASADAMTMSYGKMATRLGYVFGGFAAGAMGIASAGRTLGTFEQNMAAVASVADATEEELARMRETAKSLGSTTLFTPAEAARGLFYVAQAGYSADESIKALPAVLDLATAGQLDLGRASEITAKIMKAFQIPVTGASTVTDVLAVAANKTTTDVNELADAMKYVGPVAAALKIPLNAAAAAAGVLSNNGLNGSMAGTGLRQVLAGLANVSPQAAKALKGLGLEVADLNPATHSLTDIVDRLAAANLDAATAFTVFGDRGAPAVLALVASNNELRDLTTLMAGVNGEASRMAKTMRDQLQGDWKQFVSSVESATIQLGEAGVTGALRGTLQTGTSVFRGLADNSDLVVASVITLSGVLAGRYVGALTAAAAAERGYVSYGALMQARLQSAAAIASGSAVAIQGAQASAMRARAAAEEAAVVLASARATEAQAAANVAALRTDLELLASERALTQQRIAAQITDKGRSLQTAALIEIRTSELALTKQLTVAEVELAAAQRASAVAATTSSVAAASAATAVAATGVAARIAAGAMAGLRGVMAFFGGPIGLAITAVTVGISLLAMRSDEATTQTDNFKDAMDALNGVLDTSEQHMKRLNEEERQHAINLARSTIEAKKKALAQAEGDIAYFQQAASSAPNPYSPVTTELMRNTAREKLVELRGQVRQLKSEIPELQAGLDKVLATPAKSTPAGTVPKVVPGIVTPPAAATSGEDEILKRRRETIQSLQDENATMRDLLPAYLAGTTSVHDYNAEMEVANRLHELKIDKNSQEAQTLRDLIMENSKLRALESFASDMADTRESVKEFGQQRDALKLTAYEAERFAKEQQLLNEAIKAGVTVTPELRAQIQGLAADYANSKLELDRAKAATQEIQQLEESTFDKFGDLIAQGKFDWGDWSDAGLAAIREINAEAVKLALLNPLKNWLFGQNNPTMGDSGGLLGGMLDGIFGGSDSAGSGGITGTMDVGVAHGGGRIGQNAFARRTVPASVFDSAPRLHDGLRADEFPAILQNGEEVSSRDEVRGRKNAARPTIIFQVKDAQSIMKSRTQIAAMLTTAIAQGQRNL